MNNAESLRIENQATLAAKMGLTFEQTIVLPSAITSCAKAVNMSEAQFIIHMVKSLALRDYVASVCVKVAAENPELVAV